MTLETLLLLVIIGGPIYEMFTAGQAKELVNSGHMTKLQCYTQTIMTLWIPTLLLFVVIVMTELSMEHLGLQFKWNKAQLINWSVVTVFIGYLVYLLMTIPQNEKANNAIKTQFESVSWIMPNTIKERNWFVLGVSLSAGICEELLFRGFLIHYLQADLGVVAAVLISSLLFGLFHFYQGWQGVLKTALVGLFLALVYLWTGSLWIVIVLHFVYDAFAGQLYYLVNKSELALTKNSVVS